MSKKIVIYGIGEFAELMDYYLCQDAENCVVAFTADKAYITQNEFLGRPVVAFEEVDECFPPTEYDMFVAVGYATMRDRKRMFEKAKMKRYGLANYISKQALVEKNVRMGENNIILSGAMIEPFVNIGNNNVINTGCTICHHTWIGDHSFFAANSMIGGRCHVGNNVFLGFHATVVQYKEVADETLVAANSVLLQNSEPFGRYQGIPARLVDRHEDEGIKIKNG